MNLIIIKKACAVPITESLKEPWINRYGGKISSEWQVPKVWQVLDEAPEIYEAADHFIEAARAMGKLRDEVYTPIPANQKAYDGLYAEYDILHDYFGRGANDVMKRLKDIKKNAREVK